MQVTVETTSGLERKMRVVVPSDKVEVQVSEKIKAAAQGARLNGFRPGKVPMREIKRRFGDGIRQEVSSEVIQASFGEALQQEDITPAGMPSIEDIKSEEGNDLEFTAVFEVFPEVSLSSFESIEVEKLTSAVQDSDLDTMIETLREQHITFQEVERNSAADDKLNIDFEGFIDDEAFEGGKSEASDIVIGSGSMIPGFEDGLVGMKAGEEKDIEVSFPEAYQAENLAGKDAVFKIKVNTISEPQKPGLDEEFFKQFDVEEGGVEAFREVVKGNMHRELDAAVKAKIKDQIMEGLTLTNEVDLPKAMIDQEINRMRQEAVQRFGGGNAGLDPNLLPAEMFTDQAEKRVKLGLLVSKIVEDNELTPDDDRVKETIETLAGSYEDSEQVVNYYYSNEQQLSQIQNVVLEEQVVDLVLETAKVSEKAVSYEEAVKPKEAPVPEPDETATEEE